MKSKHSHSKIRAAGQRSILSTPLFRPQPPNQTRSGDDKQGPKLGTSSSSVSFSDYLNRKLHSNSLLPRAFQSGRNKNNDGPNQSEREEQQKETDDVIEESIFKQFNLANADGEHEQSPMVPSNDDEVETRTIGNAMQGCRIRRNTSEGGDGRSTVRSHLLILGDDVSNRKGTGTNKRPRESFDRGHIESNQMHQPTKKHLVVLGDDPKPRGGRRGQSSSNNKESNPQYNHYENGTGWWDYEREGVDNDEVGANEVWEGIGSTTLGEIIDWH